MPSNAFIGKDKRPTDEELARQLGAAKPLWDQLRAELATEYGIGIEEWNSYSPKAGWSLRLKREKRNILYLSPCRGSFIVSFALGDRAVEAARQSRLPQAVARLINEAKRYAEGTAVRIEVKAAKDVAVVKKLAVIKLEH